MKKLLYGIGILVLTLIITLSVKKCPDKIKNYEKMKNSTVSVIMTGEDVYYSCSGIVLSNEEFGAYFATAKHCVVDDTDMYVDYHPVNKIYEDPKNDIAILYLKYYTLDKKGAIFSDRKPKFNDEVWAFGYPKQEEYVTKGNYLLQGIIGLNSKIKIISGCSGGPLFNDDGELIGMNVASLRVVPSIGIAEPIKDIANLYIKILQQRIDDIDQGE